MQSATSCWPTGWRKETDLETYSFKWLPEMGFAVVVGVVTAALQILADFDGMAVDDWAFWGINVGSALARAAAVAGLAVLGKAALSRGGGG